MKYEDIQVSTEAGVASVVIDRPERRNAMSETTMREIAHALSVVGGDNGAFCAGIDIRWLNSRSAQETVGRGVSFYNEPQDMIRAILATPVPVIAAVDGPAVGMGMDLALACDLRFIGPAGWFHQGWARAGLIPATGGVRFTEALAPGLIWQLLTRQEPLRPAQAAACGLAEAAAGTALEAARSLAAQLAEMPTEALRGYVRLSRASRTDRLEDHLAQAAEIQLSLFEQGGYQDALAAQLGQ
jgi:enoyl-CoA hydratase/carnithine racemase